MVSIATGFSSFPDDIRQTSSCVTIPKDLKLCYGVGYDKMVLPNLLKHDNMKEVFHQSQSFVPLMSMKCHPLVRIFLCSLYAPVCLPDNSAVRGPIPPCKSLCQAVEKGCAPILQKFSFEWPAMLNCSQFANEDPCLSVNETLNANEGTTTTEVSEEIETSCAPCSVHLTRDSLLDNFCASEFVLKMKIKKVKVLKSSSDKSKMMVRELQAPKKKREVYKKGPLTKKDLKKKSLKFQLAGSKDCECNQLDDMLAGGKKAKKASKRHYVVMGRKVGRKFVITAIHTWTKRNKILNDLKKKDYASSACAGGLSL